MVTKITQLTLLSIGLCFASCFGMNPRDKTYSTELTKQERHYAKQIEELNWQRQDNSIDAGQYVQRIQEIIAEANENDIDPQQIISTTTAALMISIAFDGAHPQEVEQLLSIGIKPQQAWQQVFRMMPLNSEVISLLLDNGANVNAPLAEHQGKTQLHLIAHTGHDDNALGAIELLLNRGANPNGQDLSGITPLMMLITNRQASPEYFTQALFLLLNAGADVNLSNYNGKTVTSYARDAHRIKLLYDALRSYAQQAQPLPKPLPADLAHMVGEYFVTIPRDLYPNNTDIQRLFKGLRTIKQPLSAELQKEYGQLQELIKEVHMQDMRYRALLEAAGTSEDALYTQWNVLEKSKENLMNSHTDFAQKYEEMRKEEKSE